MKTKSWIGLAFAFTSLMIVGCAKTDSDELKLSDISCVKLDTINFSHSMKGWELYSFHMSSNWKYSLLIGTNAIKTYDQVTQNRISVIGQDSLKVLLSKLPVNEEVTWIGSNWLGMHWQASAAGNFALPSRAIQIDIKEFCDNHGIQLTIVE